MMGSLQGLVIYPHTAGYYFIPIHPLYTANNRWLPITAHVSCNIFQILFFQNLPTSGRPVGHYIVEQQLNALFPIVSPPQKKNKTPK